MNGEAARSPPRIQWSKCLQELRCLHVYSIVLVGWGAGAIAVVKRLARRVLGGCFRGARDGMDARARDQFGGILGFEMLIGLDILAGLV